MAASFVRKFFLLAIFVFACSTSEEQAAFSSQPSSSLTIVKSGSLVQIGSQIWFAENTNAEPRKGNKWCYSNSEQNCAIYGGLYDWEAANNVCPDGYRLPSKNDFDILFDLGESKINEIFNASSVFNALLGGQKVLDGFGQDFFMFKDSYAFWWTSSDGGVRDHAHSYEFNGFKLYSSTYKKIAAFSVRCLLNGNTMPSSSSRVVPNSSSSRVVLSSSSSVVPNSSPSASSSSSISRCGGLSSGVIYNPNTEACCGTNKFTKATHFCLDNDVVPLCGNSTYTSSEFCFEDNKIESKCGKIPSGAIYDLKTEKCCGTSKYDITGTSTQFCSKDEIYDKCAKIPSGLTYDPNTEFCLDDKVTKKCNGKEYDSDQFCLNDKIYDRCAKIPSGLTYDPSTEFCLDDKVTKKCNGKEYSSSQFCVNEADGPVLDKCGDRGYNPNTEFCLDDKVTKKCEDGKEYTSDQFCFNEPVGPIRYRCGRIPSGLTYNPNTEACCGNEKLNIDTHFCYGNNEIRNLCDGQLYLENQFCNVDNKVEYRCGKTFLGDTLNRKADEDCCGTKRYNIKTHFCYGSNQIRDLCGGYEGLPYHENQFCSIDDKVEYKCGGMSSGDTLDRKTEDCCGTKRYSPSTHFCSGNIIYQLCNNMKYNPSTQFCSGNIIYQLCNNRTYNPSTEDCCGTSIIYSKSTHFCSGNSIHQLCNSHPYDPSTQFCSGNSIHQLCNSQPYNPSTHFCSGNSIYQLCNNQNYNPSTHFCSGNSIHQLCNSQPYNPSTEVCCGTHISPATEPCEP